MKKDRYIIWTNQDLDINDWRDELIEHFSINGIDNPSEYDLYMAMHELNNMYLDDERINLNIELPEEIIAIANLGLWDGRHVGYKETHNTNIADCLYCLEDYETFYVDELGDLRQESTHHDGTNYILYRQWREGLSDTQKENFIDKVYRGKVTRRDINRYTIHLGDKIAKVYGWKVRKAS